MFETTKVSYFNFFEFFCISLVRMKNLNDCRDRTHEFFSTVQNLNKQIYGPQKTNDLSKTNQFIQAARYVARNISNLTNKLEELTLRKSNKCIIS